jgi:hypothetical protein
MNTHFLLFLFLSLRCVDGTITIVDTDKHLPSKPDSKVGQRLWKGYGYMARLQYVPGNLPLCGLDNGGRTWNITRPPDGLPGTYRRIYYSLK